MKETSGLLGKTDITSCNIREVVMQTAEPFSTREATQSLVKILNSSYVKADLEQVASNATHLEAEEIT